MNNAFTFKKAVFAVAATATLLLTGCAGATSEPAASTSASPSVDASVAAADPSAAPVSSIPASALAQGGQTAAQQMTPSYQDRLAVGSFTIKAGENLHVYGGTLEPGTVVKVYGAQQMAMPSYDAANDMYHQVGDEVKLTDTVTATVDAKGVYDVQLLIPAGTPAQLVNIVMTSSDGRGDLVQTTVE